MRQLLLLPLLSLLLLANSDCHHQGKGPYKGRLAVAGICMNYTFELVEGTIDSSRVETNWTDETTGKVYHQAFSVVNVCDLPKNLKAGDEFYFDVDTTPPKPCMVCEAYYPKPVKQLVIKVTN